MGCKYGVGRTCQGWVTAPGKGCPCTQHPACRRDAQLWDHRRDAREPRMILPGLCQPPHRRSREAVGGENGSKPALAASRSTESPSLKDAVNPQPAPSSCSTAHGPTRHPAAQWVFPGTSPARQRLSSLLAFHFRARVTWASVPISRWDCIPVAGLSTSCCD